MKAFLKACAVFTALVLATPSIAADKGGPPAKVDALGELKSQFNGCHASMGGALIGLSTEGVSDSVRGFTIGAGCDVARGSVIFGAGVNYTFGEQDARMLAGYGRVGYAINPHLLLAGVLTYATDGKDPSFKDGMVMAGVELETYVSKRWTIKLGAHQTIKSLGDFKPVDGYLFRGDLSYRW